MSSEEPATKKAKVEQSDVETAAKLIQGVLSTLQPSSDSAALGQQHIMVLIDSSPAMYVPCIPTTTTKQRRNQSQQDEEEMRILQQFMDRNIKK